MNISFSLEQFLKDLEYLVISTASRGHRGRGRGGLVL